MAVIRRTECWGLSIRLLSQGIFLVLVLEGALSSPLCEQARKDVANAGFPVTWIEDAPNGGETCGRNSCCSKQSEQEMFVDSKKQLDRFLRDSITKLSSLVEVRAKRFDALFREMMNTSKIEFHEMFQKTYGKIYLQNSDVFSLFFQQLETYYKKGSTRLTDILESFFVVLYQRMFTVINSPYFFDDDYLECVSDHMKDVKPFGDLPHKFTLQLRRSFIATRTYYKALLTAAESARKLTNVGFDKECEKELVEMQFCGSCNGFRGVGTCSGYCSGVLQKCLRHQLAFSSHWDGFIDALDKVAERLVGPYNIEVVVEPLNIKISEAIMNFQESGTEVSQKIFTICGKPELKRRKRQTNYKDSTEDNEQYEVKYSPLKKLGHKKKKNKKIEDEDNSPSLERLIRDIRTRVRETRQFWAQLPYQFCNNLTAPPSANGRCWNGTAIGAYAAPAPPAGNSSAVKEQIYVLQLFTDQLRKAFSGEEVEFADDTEDALDGSGSGSGDFEIDGAEEGPKAATEDDLQVENEVPRAPPTSPPEAEVPPPQAGGGADMSLNKALAQFLLPIVLVWFGGAISDLL